MGKRRSDKKGRSAGDPRFVQMPYWVMESEAFRRLSPRAITVLFFMVKRHNGINNGRIAFGIRSGCFIKKPGTNDLIDAAIGIGRTGIGEALAELQAAGFIACETESVFVRTTAFREGERHTREWRLTWLPVGDVLPTKEFVTPKSDFQKPRKRSKIFSSDRTSGQVLPKLTEHPVSPDELPREITPICPDVRSALVKSRPSVRSHLETIPTLRSIDCLSEPLAPVSAEVLSSRLTRDARGAQHSRRAMAPVTDLNAVLSRRLASEKSR